MELPWMRTDQREAGPEAIVMASRFRLTTVWYGPAFLFHAMRLWRQARRSPGVLGVSLRAEPRRATYWTLSAWVDEQALRAYARTNPHGRAMKRLPRWMKDSAFRFWAVPTRELPATNAAANLWAEAQRRITAPERV